MWLLDLGAVIVPLGIEARIHFCCSFLAKIHSGVDDTSLNMLIMETGMS